MKEEIKLPDEFYNAIPEGYIIENTEPFVSEVYNDNGDIIEGELALILDLKKSSSEICKPAPVSTNTGLKELIKWMEIQSEESNGLSACIAFERCIEKATELLSRPSVSEGEDKTYSIIHEEVMQVREKVWKMREDNNICIASIDDSISDMVDKIYNKLKPAPPKNLSPKE